MEPQYSVLLFSKYSRNCTALIQRMQTSKVDFSGIQALCVDNEQIRNRIKADKQFEISSVPSILLLFPNGTVQKFEGPHAFAFIEGIIKANTPPPEPVQFSAPPPQPVQTRPRVVRPAHIVAGGPDPQESMQDNIGSDRFVVEKKAREGPHSGYVIPGEDRQPPPPRPRARPQPQPQPEPEQVTPLSEIPEEEEEEESDRYRTPVPPRRFRKNDMTFEDDPSLYQGVQVDRHEPSGGIRRNSDKNVQDPHGTASKAQQLQRAREEIEQEVAPKSRRPMEARRP